VYVKTFNTIIIRTNLFDVVLLLLPRICQVMKKIGFTVVKTIKIRMVFARKNSCRAEIELNSLL